ncbi:MAG: hypothetical protein KIT68_01400 [Phycisphaeraceae bacterium]|nr:hypothetical protein [Phycisphaeraceae bacterium]
MNHKTRTCGTIAAAGLLLGLAFGVGAAGGCEERVVRATGPGADNVEISRPFYETPKWERDVFGDPNPPKQRTR